MTGSNKSGEDHVAGTPASPSYPVSVQITLLKQAPPFMKSG